MALRPPRSGLSVGRLLSERARAATPPSQSTTNSPSLAASMAEALRGLADKLAQAAQQGAHEAAEPALQSGQLERRIGTKAASLVFGYTLRMGQDGVSAEPFGDVPAAKSGPAKATSEPLARQPITEILVEDGCVTVLAELPGADPAHVICTPQGSELLIETLAGRRYRKALELPMAVRPDGMTQSFANGILEVRLSRADLP